ncbi:Translocation protein SEC62 [Fasciola hepatica]|uniref:Translocation protein SEC62 n=1 Tax=Fasciola hepatica TaxID=6192 RepID=A0A4E0RDK4_FASHE|nr:Translocation protein SEC62 [Fasciola hepatica]
MQKPSMDKRKKRKHLGDCNPDKAWKPSSDETEVATYMYRKLPAQEARLSGMVVRVFVAEDAVSLLMESPWSAATNTTNPKKAKPCFFSTRDGTVSFLSTLLQKQMFHRAVKVVRSKVSRKKREEAKTATGKSAAKKLSSDTKSSSEKNSTVTVEAVDKVEGDQASSTSSVTDKRNHLSPQSITDGSHKSVPTNQTSKDSTAKSASSSTSSTKPMKIEISDNQLFVLDDPQTVYVWIYEPPPGLFNWLAGSALLIGIILCCLFPIWPTELRSGAYYLTLIASALFGLLLVVALLRLVLYFLFWICTLGKYGFWLFPNYFEDCGFFESFRPVYSLTAITSDGTVTKRLKEKSRLKSASTGLANAAKTDQDFPSVNKLSSSKVNHLKTRKENSGKID